jgi:hypothetical protein
LGTVLVFASRLLEAIIVLQEQPDATTAAVRLASRHLAGALFFPAIHATAAFATILCAIRRSLSAVAFAIAAL